MKTEAAESSDQTTIQIYLVDDHPIVRNSLRDMLNDEPGIAVVGEAASYDGALELFRHNGVPDVAVVNLTLHRRSGLVLIKELKVTYPSVRILAFSMHDERLYATRALRAGAKGYLMKTTPPREIVEAIWQIHNGQLVASAEVREQLLAETAGLLSGLDRNVGQLTDTELAVLGCLGRGMESDQIADALALAPQSMRTHYEKLKAKMGCLSMRELTQEAFRFVQRYEL